MAGTPSAPSSLSRATHKSSPSCVAISIAYASPSYQGALKSVEHKDCLNNKHEFLPPPPCRERSRQISKAARGPRENLLGATTLEALVLRSEHWNHAHVPSRSPKTCPEKQKARWLLASGPLTAVSMSALSHHSESPAGQTTGATRARQQQQHIRRRLMTPQLYGTGRPLSIAASVMAGGCGYTPVPWQGCISWGRLGP